MTTCINCLGRGYINCPECDGSGRRWSEYLKSDILKGLDPRCYECNGTGHVECPECDGTGWVKEKK